MLPPGIKIMYYIYNLFLSLPKEKQYDLIRYLNYIAPQFSIEKITRKNINQKNFEYLCSKASYNTIRGFNAQKGHKGYSIENILKELGISVRKRKKQFVIPKKLIKEIEEYKEFVTSKYNVDLDRRQYQKPATFESLTRVRIRQFLKYLIKERELEINTFKESISYFKDYCQYLIRKMEEEKGGITETFKISTRWISSYTAYLKYIDNANRQTYTDISEYYHKLLSHIDYIDGTTAKNKSNILSEVTIKDIISMIKKIERIYTLTWDKAKLKELVVILILTHLSWRSRNILLMNLGDTVFYEKGKYYYRFTPAQQKAPQKEGNTLKDITGEFPPILQTYLPLYIKEFGVADWVFTNSKGVKYRPSYFSSYVRSVTKKYLNHPIPPHFFRTLVFSYLINETHLGYVKSELYLWHKPIALSGVSLRYTKVDINDAVLSANKELMKLYKEADIIKWKGKRRAK
jgi:hypothetical protein